MQYRDGRSFVTVLEKRDDRGRLRTRQVEVETGAFDVARIQVVSGLEEGWEIEIPGSAGSLPGRYSRRGDTPRTGAAIRLQGVTKIYRTGGLEVHALRGVGLTVEITVEKGEFVSVIGASGSGKSTLLNVIGCLDTPTAGRYFLHGQEVGPAGCLFLLSAAAAHAVPAAAPFLSCAAR